MKNVKLMATMLLALALLAPGCTPGGPAPATPAPTAVSQKPSGDVASPGWERKWEATLAAAKQEGEILIYLNAPSEARGAIPDAFNKRFGIKMDVVMGSGAAIASRLDAEYRSGIHQVDAFLPGTTSAVGSKNQGFLSRLEPMLILPEVTDPKVWLGGKLPLFDKDGMIVAYLSVRIPPVIYNSAAVKEGQISSYLDLLKPEWKGKMTMFDPTIPGAGNFWATGMTREFGPHKVNEFFTALVRQQQVIVTRDMRQQMEWVARDKYPVAIFPQTPAVTEFLKVGAPIAAASFKEISGVSPSNGGLAVPAKPPHPNAATIFVNWFLSKEGQALAVKTIVSPSTRLDVPAEGVPPMFVVNPQEKFFLQSEDFTRSAIQWVDGWRKIFVQ
ncbi:MAG: extracellular solute-binding protein [Chloroflexi bacterium]|nr:extracellular solute-binding protein [Chloroflexota bacterium]